jgi:hypothetical protein
LECSRPIRQAPFAGNYRTQPMLVSAQPLLVSALPMLIAVHILEVREARCMSTEQM